MQVDVGYPDIDAERQMLIATTGPEQSRAEPVMTGEELIAAQRLVRRVPVGESVVETILSLVRSGRPETSDIPRSSSRSPGGRGPGSASR